MAAAIYPIDKPYAYLIPEALLDRVCPGVRVTVPFGRGNRHSEGFVLALEEDSGDQPLKSIDSVLDSAPVLTEEQLQLALFVRDRFFCTLFEAARAMLPAGLWFRGGKRQVGDKLLRYAALAIPAEDAVVLANQKRLQAPQQSALLRALAELGEVEVADLLDYTGASANSLHSLVKAETVTLSLREVFRRPAQTLVPEAEPLTLNEEQQAVCDGVTALMATGKPEAALLYGVTGSGKTAVYIELVRTALERGRTALVLVPEIALTPQFVRQFASHFGEAVAVLHSSLTMGERYDEWKRIRSGAVRVVIGTRSAVFAPLTDLGLIIIDEEQEHTYKSENNPRYAAADVAKRRCVSWNAVLLLGSATPSVESMYRARQGTYRLFTLPHRFNARPLPEVIIADMRAELKKGNGGLFSGLLKEELEKNLEAGEQSILFLNRRGASAAVLCGECGRTFTCPNCSVSLTYHSVGRKFLCHYCGHMEPLPDWCPDCGGKLKFVGAGTQKAEEELNLLFPGQKVIRMDADTVQRAGSHDKLLTRFREERIPFLLGTQMVSKGLDFSNVTLVGVLSADQSLYSTSYRARERTFSLITQVVGRSGRGSKAGRAVIQTFTPENEVITLAAQQDYTGFYEREILLREVIHTPPLRELISLTVTGMEQTPVQLACMKLHETLRYYFRDFPELEILGPAPAGIAKINNRFRYRLLVSCRNTRQVRDTIAHILKAFANDKSFRGLTAYADADPME